MKRPVPNGTSLRSDGSEGERKKRHKRETTEREEAPRDANGQRFLCDAFGRHTFIPKVLVGERTKSGVVAVDDQRGRFCRSRAALLAVSARGTHPIVRIR